MTKYIKAYNIPIFLLCCQSLNSKLLLDKNTINFLNLPLDNNKQNIKLVILNNDKEEIRSADIDKYKKNIKSSIINKKKLVISNWIFWNKLISEFFSTFKKMTFNKSNFQANTPVWKIRYKHPKS